MTSLSFWKREPLTLAAQPLVPWGAAEPALAHEAGYCSPSRAELVALVACPEELEVR